MTTKGKQLASEPDEEFLEALDSKISAFREKVRATYKNQQGNMDIVEIEDPTIKNKTAAIRAALIETLSPKGGRDRYTEQSKSLLALLMALTEENKTATLDSLEHLLDIPEEERGVHFSNKFWHASKNVKDRPRSKFLIKTQKNKGRQRPDQHKKGLFYLAEKKSTKEDILVQQKIEITNLSPLFQEIENKAELIRRIQAVLSKIKPTSTVRKTILESMIRALKANKSITLEYCWQQAHKKFVDKGSIPAGQRVIPIQHFQNNMSKLKRESAEEESTTGFSVIKDENNNWQPTLLQTTTAPKITDEPEELDAEELTKRVIDGLRHIATDQTLTKEKAKFIAIQVLRKTLKGKYAAPVEIANSEKAKSLNITRENIDTFFFKIRSINIEEPRILGFEEEKQGLFRFRFKLKDNYEHAPASYSRLPSTPVEIPNGTNFDQQDLCDFYHRYYIWAKAAGKINPKKVQMYMLIAHHSSRGRGISSEYIAKMTDWEIAKIPWELNSFKDSLERTDLGYKLVRDTATRTVYFSRNETNLKQKPKSAQEKVREVMDEIAVAREMFASTESLVEKVKEKLLERGWDKPNNLAELVDKVLEERFEIRARVANARRHMESTDESHRMFINQFLDYKALTGETFTTTELIAAAKQQANLDIPHHTIVTTYRRIRRINEEEPELLGFSIEEVRPDYYWVRKYEPELPSCPTKVNDRTLFDKDVKLIYRWITKHRPHDARIQETLWVIVFYSLQNEAISARLAEIDELSTLTAREFTTGVMELKRLLRNKKTEKECPIELIRNPDSTYYVKTKPLEPPPRNREEPPVAEELLTIITTNAAILPLEFEGRGGLSEKTIQIVDPSNKAFDIAQQVNPNPQKRIPAVITNGKGPQVTFVDPRTLMPKDRNLITGIIEDLIDNLMERREDNDKSERDDFLSEIMAKMTNIEEIPIKEKALVLYYSTKAIIESKSKALGLLLFLSLNDKGAPRRTLRELLELTEAGMEQFLTRTKAYLSRQPDQKIELTSNGVISIRLKNNV